MHKLLLVLITFVLTTTSALCLNGKHEPSVPESFVLQWGFVYMPPLAYQDEEGKTKGELAEMMTAVSKLSGIAHEPMQFPNARAIFNLNQKKINFAIGMKSLIDNKEGFITSTFPVSKVQLLIVHLEETEAVNSIEELKGKDLVLLSGYTYGGLRGKFEEIAANTFNVDNHNRAIEGLKLKRGDYALLYKTSSEFSLGNNNPADFKSTIVGEVELFFMLNKNVEQSSLIMQKLESSFLCYKEMLTSVRDQTNIHDYVARSFNKPKCDIQ
ncbi:hypothetical protein [Glaciecola sp.]|uniref:substrate-binding periplasmic protein n=1 Tax=Glaciecola sp. MF2-115 TaxID=3384827 RepID=UPI00398A4FF3